MGQIMTQVIAHTLSDHVHTLSPPPRVRKTAPTTVVHNARQGGGRRRPAAPALRNVRLS